MIVVVGTLLHIVLSAVFCRSVFYAVIHFDQCFELFVGRAEGAGSHAERQQNAFFEEIFPALSGDDFYDCGADVDSGVGVLDTSAGLEEQRRCGCDGGRLTQRGAAAPSAALDVALFCADFKRETAGVIHDHADCQCVFRFDESPHSIFFRRLYPKVLEFGQILRDRIVQRDPSFFDEHGNGYSAEAFGLGALHVNVIHGDGAFCCDICISDACIFLNAVFIEDADCAGKLSGLDKGSQRFFCKSRVGVFDFRMEREAREEHHRCDEHHSVKKFH